MVAVVVAGLLAVALCVFLDWIIHKRVWDLLAKIPGPKPWPLLGNAKEVGLFDSRRKILNPLTLFFESQEGQVLIYRKEKICILWAGRQPIVFMTSPETVELILKSSTAVDKGTFYHLMIPWLGDGLLLSNGQKWHKHRKLLTPSFHFRLLDNFVGIMNEQADVLVSKITYSSRARDWLDCFDYFSKCTLDIISETAMGIQQQAQEKDSTYAAMVHNVSFAITYRSSRPWLQPDFIYYLTKRGKDFLSAVQYLHDVTNKVIAEKIAERNKKSSAPQELQKEDEVVSEFGGKKRLAFLDLLLESGLTQQELREQVDTFMFAGHDTTATALSWMSYLLGLHPDVQDRLLEEVDLVFGEDKDRHVNQEDLKDLKYMDCVIKESQRVYPSVPGVSRNIDKDTEIGGYMIPKGTECFVAIFSVHRDPAHYPNPEVFDPDRFLPENSSGRHPYSFIPFSAGPRNCIGQKFALLEQKIIMCHILRNFRILSLDPRDKIRLVPELVLRTDQPLRITFIPRVKS